MSTWKERIAQLRDTGLNISEIAARVGLATSTVGDLATGRSKSPRGNAAIALHNLYTERCSDRRVSKRA